MLIPDHIILFDGVCNLCNNSVQRVIRNDKRGIFKFAAMQSPVGQELLSKHGLGGGHVPDSIVYINRGKAYVRSTAVLRTARKMDGAYPLAFSLLIIPRFLRDAVYDLVARNRYRWFGKQETCIIPTPELRSRFLNSIPSTA